MLDYVKDVSALGTVWRLDLSVCRGIKDASALVNVRNVGFLNLKRC